MQTVAEILFNAYVSTKSAQVVIKNLIDKAMRHRQNGRLTDSQTNGQSKINHNHFQ